jgi:hypothetical protein
MDARFELLLTELAKPEHWATAIPDEPNEWFEVQYIEGKMSVERISPLKVFCKYHQMMFDRQCNGCEYNCK